MRLRDAIEKLTDEGIQWGIEDGQLHVYNSIHPISEENEEMLSRVNDSLQSLKTWDEADVPKPMSDERLRDGIYQEAYSANRVSDAKKKRHKKKKQYKKNEQRQTSYTSFRLVIGIQEKDDKFKWHDVKTYGSREEAFKGYVAYVKKQQQYGEQDLRRVWKSGRLDIELLEGKKLLNWTGIFSRLAMGLDDDDDKENNKNVKEETDEDKEEKAEE